MITVAQSDLINEVDPTIVGLPPVKQKHPLKCAEAGGKPCERKGKTSLPKTIALSRLIFEDLLDSLKAKLPVFAPNQKSTYSNNNFNLLGLVIENATGQSYSDYVEANIFKPLRMHSTTLETPKKSHSVIPASENYWGVEEGVQRPTGGIYSSTSDMSHFLRYILTHYNGITHSLNWLAPASYSDTMGSFYGMPWEIFRTDKILHHSKRPITFVTKGGGLPGYFSIIMMVAEYDLGITILVAGEQKGLSKIRDLVTVPLMRAADDIAFAHLNEQYGGTYSEYSFIHHNFTDTNNLSLNNPTPQLLNPHLRKPAHRPHPAQVHLKLDRHPAFRNTHLLRPGHPQQAVARPTRPHAALPRREETKRRTVARVDYC